MGNRFSRSQKSSPHVQGGEERAEQTDLIVGQTSAGRGRLSRLRRSLSFSRSRRFKRQTIAEGPVKSFIILQDDGKDRRRLGEVEAASLDQLLTECKSLYGHESSLIYQNDQPITVAVFEDFTDTNVLTIHTGAPQAASESLTSPQTSFAPAPLAPNQSFTEGESSSRTSEHTEQEEPVDVPTSSPPAEIRQDELPQLPTDLNSAVKMLQRKEDKTPLSEELRNVEYSSSRRGEQGLVSTSLSASTSNSSKQNSQISENEDISGRTDDVSDIELRDIAKCVDATKVPDLGLLLGFGYPEIERYRKTNFLHNNVSVDGTTHMLFTWKEKTSENTDCSKRAQTEDEQFAEIFAKELRRYYKQIYCTVTTDPWDERQMDLNEYFISLSMREEDTRSRKKTKDKLKNSHNDLFNLWIDGSITDRILVFGEGGTGKSTLCKKLAYDWAKKVPQSPLKDVKILCALEFRRLQGSGDVAEAIHTQLICKDSSITPDRIKKFIQSNPTEVKLILDGYDEFDPDSYKGDINDVLAGKMMAEVTTLVTTRPWHTCLLQKQTCMYAQVSLDGFDSEGIDSFVKQYFAPDDRAARQCLEKIKYSGVIRHLARVPILLSMVCYLKKTCSEDTTEADTMNSLFTKFLRALFVNNIDKIGESRKPLYHEIPDEVDMPVLEEFWDDLGKMALEGVLKRGKKLIFPRDEFGPKTRMIEIGLKIGLLVRQKAKIHHDAFESLKVVYSFPHLLFQEKCAGDFIASHPEVMESTLAGMSNAAQTISLQYTLVFSCQRRAREGSYDNRERSRKIVEHLVSLQDNEKTDADLHSELSGITEQVPEFLDEMLVVKSHDFMRSLFLLSLMINHESGSEAELLPMIEKLDGHNPERQDYDGSLCHSFLYYLKFALPDNVSFQPCTNLSMFDIIETISLSDLLSLTTKSYRKLKSIFVSDFTGDFSLEGLPGPSLETFKLEELSLNKCQKSVHLSGLMNILSQMKIDVNTISLTYTELDLHESCNAVRQINGQQCSVQKLHINSIRMQVSLHDLLHLLARTCQNMRCLHVSYVELVLHEHNPDLMPLVVSTAIEDLEIGFVDNQLSLSELLGVASSFCPAMKRCFLHDIVLTVEDRNDTSRKECVVKSCLEELRLQNMMEDISVTGVLDVVGQSLGKCHLTLLSLDELKAYIPSHTEIVPSDDVKTQLIVDEIRLRKL
ncbi:uncharacterized protein [Diadema antillarum]|uniref:uncharacterized protein n=1 Tax=Diadema antillarum TaxID=105358 RepID=UPI003A854FBD